MLRLINLEKHYKSKKSSNHHALKKVNIDFGDKGLVFILGKSGSGKSTLLNILGGLDNFDSGDIEIKGKSSKDFKAKDWDSYRNTYVGFVFQDYNIIEHFSVSKNIALALELQRVKKKEIPARVKDILAQVELEGFEKRAINELSGGQKQRIAIARALVKNPHIILADEPTGNLDSETGAQVLKALKSLSKERLVIMVSHDREHAYEYGDRVIELKDGEVISDVVAIKDESKNGTRIINSKEQDNKVLFIPRGSNVDKSMLENINNEIDDNESVVYIPITKGKKLTEDDLDRINKLISDDNDLFIPILKPYEVDLKKEQKRYVQTSTKLLSDFVNNVSEKFKLIKSRLPFKNTFSMAFSYLWRKKFKLFFSILLFFVSLGMFGFSETVTRFKYANSLATSYKEAGIDIVTMTNTEEVEVWGHLSSMPMPFKEDELEAFMNEFKDVRYAKSYDLSESNISFGHSEKITYPKSISGFLEVADYSILNVELLHGEYTSSNDQIVITDYVGQYFVDKFKQFNSLEDVVGHQYMIGMKKYTITGIIDTDYETYEHINDLPQSDLYENKDYNEFKSNERSLYSRLFVNDGFYAEYVNNINSFSNVIQFEVSHPEPESDWDTYHVSSSGLKYSDEMLNHTFKDQFLIVPNDFADLKENEIIVDLNTLESMINPDEDNKIHDMWNKARNKYPRKGAAEEFYKQLLKSGYINFEKEITAINTHQGWMPIDKTTYKVVGVIDFDTYRNYNQNDIIYNLLVEEGYKFTNNELKEMKRDVGYYNYIVTTRYMYHLIKENGGEVLTEKKYYRTGGNDYWSYLQKEMAELDLKITPPYQDMWSPIVFNENKFQQITPYSENKVSSIVVNLPEDVNSTMKFFDRTKDEGMRQQTTIGKTLDIFNEFVKEAAHIFKYVSLVFALFASVLMFTNISSSVLAAKKEIGTLRAIGARGSDVGKIFVLEGLMIAGFTISLAILALNYVAGMLNSELTQQLGIQLSIFNVSFIIILEMVVLSLFIVFCSTFLPVTRVSLMKPINAIKNK